MRKGHWSYNYVIFCVCKRVMDNKSTHSMSQRLIKHIKLLLRLISQTDSYFKGSFWGLFTLFSKK